MKSGNNYAKFIETMNYFKKKENNWLILPFFIENLHGCVKLVM